MSSGWNTSYNVVDFGHNGERMSPLENAIFPMCENDWWARPHARRYLIQFGIDFGRVLPCLIMRIFYPFLQAKISHIVSRTVGSGERIEEKMVAFIIAGTILL